MKRISLSIFFSSLVLAASPMFQQRPRIEPLEAAKGIGLAIALSWPQSFIQEGMRVGLAKAAGCKNVRANMGTPLFREDNHSIWDQFDEDEALLKAGPFSINGIFPLHSDTTYQRPSSKAKRIALLLSEGAAAVAAAAIIFAGLQGYMHRQPNQSAIDALHYGFRHGFENIRRDRQLAGRGSKAVRIASWWFAWQVFRQMAGTVLPFGRNSRGAKLWKEIGINDEIIESASRCTWLTPLLGPLLIV